MDTVQIFDTTLRDGEQSPGASMDVDQKFEIALQLERLGVDVIEAGFPISSPEQMRAIVKISEHVKDSTIAALCRSVDADIEAAAESIKKAARPRIHTFISTSPIHMEYQLKKKPEEVLEMTRHAVRYARKLCPEVEFSPEDATRTHGDFLVQVLDIAIAEGATILNIPDTVGYTVPNEYAELITTLRERVANSDKAIWSVHCHNDLGLAVANSVSAVAAGARQVEVTINGIGERAGNASLEELVMALATRKDVFGLDTRIKSEQLYTTARMVSTMIGFPIPRNKAIVGENAFAHEAGIHQHGMLSHRETYEIMTPQSVGREATRIVLGRHSGMHGFRKRLAELSIMLEEQELKAAYQDFLHIADRKTEVFDEDLYAIISERVGASPESYALEYVHFQSGNTMVPTATVRVRDLETVREEAATGDGPVDAAFRAIERACKIEAKLVDYNVAAITPGKNALGEATVVLEIAGKRSTGHGSSTDIVEASAKAYLSAINRHRLLAEVVHP